MTGYIREQGAELARAGYPVVAIYPGDKRPYGNDWQNSPMTSEQCEKCDPAFGVGILCGYGTYPIVGLDADIEGDEALASVVQTRWRQVFGFETSGFVRVGKPPKFLVMARIDKPISKIMSSWFVKDGREIRVEVLGKGQQFVAYHTHPDTGKPYEWTGNIIADNPYEITPQDLVPITIDQIRLCLSIFEQEATLAGYQKKGGAKESANEEVLSWEDVEPELPPLKLTTLEVTTMLKEAEIDNTGYDTWLDVGMALHHQFLGSREGRDIWDAWSATAPNYDASAIEVKWDSFGAGSGRKKTFRWVRNVWREKVNALAKDPNEAGLKYRLIRAFNGKIKYVGEKKYFRSYKNGRWEYIDDSRIKNIAQSVIENGIAQEIKLGIAGQDPNLLFSFRAKCLGSLTSRSENMFKLVKGDPCVYSSVKDYDAQPNLFAVGNGVYDLEKDEFVASSPEQMLSRGSDVVYDPEAKCPLWEASVLQIMDGNKDMVRFLQRCAGYAMSGDPIENVMFLLIGNGCNGKSVFLNTLGKVFGTHKQTVQPEFITQTGKALATNANGANAILMSIAGARMCLCSETEIDAVLRESLVKQLASREEIAGRALYAPDLEYVKPTWVFFLATNHVPTVRGQDHGIWRRLMPIAFNVNFDEPGRKKDLRLEDKLEKELPGILNWCIEGYRLYRYIGLSAPKEVTDFCTEVKENADILAEWLADRCVLDPSAKLQVTQAYTSWKLYIERSNEVARLSRRSFSKLMSERFKKTTMTGHLFAFAGLRLKTDFDKEN